MTRKRDRIKKKKLTLLSIYVRSVINFFSLFILRRQNCQGNWFKKNSQIFFYLFPLNRLHELFLLIKLVRRYYFEKFWRKLCFVGWAELDAISTRTSKNALSLYKHEECSVLTGRVWPAPSKNYGRGSQLAKNWRKTILLAIARSWQLLLRYGVFFFLLSFYR